MNVVPENETLVIVPTYNERESLPPLVEEIRRVCPGIGLMVVDDASPDGTGDVAEALRERHGRLEVLHRPRRTGLGDAYRQAMAEALRGDAAYFVTMDADLSHAPAHLPDLIGGLIRDDVVIGSRYVAGGGIEGWSWRRRFLSRAANGYARAFTGLGVRDCTSGYVGYRRRVLEKMPLGRLRSQGYCFLVEMKYLAALFGFSLAETPIVFTDRARDASKMSWREAREASWKVASMRCRRRAYRPEEGSS